MKARLFDKFGLLIASVDGEKNPRPTLRWADHAEYMERQRARSFRLEESAIEPILPTIRTLDLEGVEVDNAGTWARYRER